METRTVLTICAAGFAVHMYLLVKLAGLLRTAIDNAWMVQ